MTTGYNSRGRSLGRSTGRRMTLTGRASAEGTLQWRHDHAVPLPPGRCWCPVCWREYEVLNGFPRRHGCIPERAVVLLGPLRPPPAEEAPKPPVVHAPGVYGDDKARCGQPNVHLLSEDDPTCIRCIRRLAYEVRSVL